jgi:hypothetical protein
MRRLRVLVPSAIVFSIALVLLANLSLGTLAPSSHASRLASRSAAPLPIDRVPPNRLEVAMLRKGSLSPGVYRCTFFL